MNKKYDDHKICFIVCTNNQLFMEECSLYLNLLEVPEGFTTELLTVIDAKSMAAGYNEAMKTSDAKYKVYLHQDTFITNRRFIYDILEIFEKDETIGIIGMIGAEKLPQDGVMWNVNRCGNFYKLDESLNKGITNIEKVTDILREVQVVDGFLMVTQYDILWREDIIKGFDFYDVSQCFEFRRKGLKTVVAAQKYPWTIHKCGVVSLWDYNKWRKVFLKEYLCSDEFK